MVVLLTLEQLKLELWGAVSPGRVSHVELSQAWARPEALGQT